MRSVPLLIVLVVFGLAGCGALPTPPADAPVSTYQLAPQLPAASEAATKVATARRVIAVSRPTASPAFATPRLAYQQRDFDVRYYASNEWVAAPPDLLERVLVDALGASGRFAAVVGDTDTRLAGRRLDVDIRALTHDLRTSPPTARVVLRAQLIDAERGQLLGVQDFQHVESLGSTGPYAGVQGLNAALEAVLPELIEFAAAP